jgi:plasmid replication initiation protein
VQLFAAPEPEDTAVLERLREACGREPELAAAYAYRSAFAGSARSELTIGLVLDDAADAARIANALGRRVDDVRDGQELLFQVLGAEGTADIAGAVTAFDVRD